MSVIPLTFQQINDAVRPANNAFYGAPVSIERTGAHLAMKARVYALLDGPRPYGAPPVTLDELNEAIWGTDED